MNISALLLAVTIWLVCVFAALAFFVSRINSVRKYTEQAIERANTRTDERLHKFDDSYSDSLITLSKRIQKLEDSKICVLETGTDKVRKTSLYAITKVGYSTELVSLTDDELAILSSFIDWACLEDEYIAKKIDNDYEGVDWRNKK